VSVPLHGFYPESIKQAKAAIRELARVLLTGRPDAELLRPVLISTLTSSLNDFVKYHQLDASEGFASPADRHQFMQEATKAMASWPEQGQKKR
jgi:hypothetical protein